jgi:hypothetical protein
MKAANEILKEKILADKIPAHKKGDYHKKFFPKQTFADSDQGFIDSIRLKRYWIHSFFLFSVIWSFGSILKDEYKGEFEDWIKGQATEEGFKRELAKDKKSKEKTKTPQES